MSENFHVRSFDSVEEMLAEQAERERQANASVVDKQREVTWGSYFCQPLSGGLWVFGRVLSEQEIEEEEGPDEIRILQDAYARGYRFSFCSSVIEEGEYGSKHIAAIWPIPEDDYNRAKQSGWQPWPELWVRVKHEMEEAMRPRG